jgi:hypothetical protein
MLVNSAIELYTMLLAWHLYDGLWSILSGTGIGAIPFVVVIIKTLLDFQEREGVTSKQIVRALEVKLYSMLFVFFIGVTPFINLYTENTKYYHSSCPADDSSSATVSEKSFGDSGTTLDSEEGRYAAMMGSQVPQAPLWWYVFSRLNIAIANSLKFELPCRADIASVAANLSVASITDPQLRQEAVQFNNDCWLPASNKFMRENPDVPPSLADDDRSYFGSQFFVTQQGFYDSFRTKQGLKAFDYSVLHGDDIQSDGADGLGWPTCDRWWSDDTNGLRKRLLSDVKNGTMANSIGDWNGVASSYFGSSTQADDQLLKTAIVSPGAQSPTTKLAISNSQIDGGWSSLEGWINGATGAGLLFDGPQMLMESQVLKAGAPVIQAFALMMFVIVLPLLLLFSLYELGTLVSLTVVQFSIIFWSFLFALALWLNNFLMSSLMDGRWIDMVNTGDQPMEAMVTLWIVRFTYLLLPLLFSVLLGVVGNNLGLGIEKGLGGLMYGSAKSGSSAGKHATGAIGKRMRSGGGKSKT